jgi:hypothetical protein
LSSAFIRGFLSARADRARIGHRERLGVNGRLGPRPWADGAACPESALQAAVDPLRIAGEDLRLVGIDQHRAVDLAFGVVIVVARRIGFSNALFPSGWHPENGARLRLNPSLKAAQI